MKKSIIILCVILSALSLTSFGYVYWNNSTTSITADKKSPITQTGLDMYWDINAMANNMSSSKSNDLDLYYNVSNRWSTMTKEALHSANSL